jgi:hypothetical protein
MKINCHFCLDGLMCECSYFCHGEPSDAQKPFMVGCSDGATDMRVKPVACFGIDGVKGQVLRHWLDSKRFDAHVLMVRCSTVFPILLRVQQLRLSAHSGAILKWNFGVVWGSIVLIFHMQHGEQVLARSAWSVGLM